MPYRDETAPPGTSPAPAAMINNPILAVLPFFVLLVAGFTWQAGSLLTLAFLYQGAWCTFRHTQCGTPACGVTGPLFLLIAVFSLLRWVPPFSSSSIGWSDWSHLMLACWLGTIAAFAAQWLHTRDRRDLVTTAGLLVASLLDYLY